MKHHALRWCAYAQCPTPTVPFADWTKRKYHPTCAVRHHLDAARTRAQRVRTQTLPAVRHLPREDEDESDAAIEQRYQAALVEVKRRPREVVVAWPSSLMRFQ
jgi:hypothetical protein